MKGIETKYDEVISLQTDIYPLESIQLAACSFLDAGFFYIYPANDSGKMSGINVALKARDGVDIDSLAGRFANELNRQSLRLALDKMNRKVRTQIVGRALESAIPVPDEES